MERQIKFRAFIDHKKTKNQSDVVYWKLYDEAPAKHNLLDNSEGEFIGISDMDRKEIYEGDIIIMGNGSKREVRFYRYCFWFIDIEHGWKFPIHMINDEMGNDYRIIGNIHRNPELLK